MAALQGQVAFGAGATCPLSAGIPRTPVSVSAPSNQRLKILGYGFFFDGTLNSAQPVEIDIKRATAAGSGTTATPQPNEGELTETFQSSWLIDCTTEPTYTSTLKTITVHPQLGYEVPGPGRPGDHRQRGRHPGIPGERPGGGEHSRLCDVRGVSRCRPFVAPLTARPRTRACQTARSRSVAPSATRAAARRSRDPSLGTVRRCSAARSGWAPWCSGLR